jgi:parallel beta-helix repeat protein
MKAGLMTLTTAGEITQTGPMTVTGAGTITNTAGAITLGNAGNDFASLTVTNGTRNVTIADKNDLSLAGITSGNATLSTGGAVTQTAAITATALAVATVNGAVTLTNASNDVTSLQVTSGSQPASFTDKTGVSLSTIAAGAFTLRAGGAVTQTQAATTTSFDVATTLGGVNIGNAGNSLGTLSANLSAAGAPLTVVNSGLLRVAQISTKGPITISTLNGGNVNIGPAGTPAPTLQTTSTVNFTGVSGGIVMANGGTMVAPGGVTVPTGKRIQWTLTSSANSGAGSLRDTLLSINSLRAPAQITYTAPATINLTSSLPTVTVPLSVVGRSQLTLDGSAAGAGVNGLTLSSTATRSSINGVTFQNFSGAGLNIAGAAATAVSAVVVTNSGIGLRASGALASAGINAQVTGSTFIGNVQGAYLNATGMNFGIVGQGNTLTGNASTTAGIFITGASSGSTVRGNTISQATNGISISSATGIVIGGTAAGQFNTVSYATTGVFATGTCTGSSVVKTAFGPAVTTKYNTAGARGLSVIQ